MRPQWISNGVENYTTHTLNTKRSINSIKKLLYMMSFFTYYFTLVSSTCNLRFFKKILFLTLWKRLTSIDVIWNNALYLINVTLSFGNYHFFIRSFQQKMQEFRPYAFHYKPSNDWIEKITVKRKIYIHDVEKLL